MKPSAILIGLAAGLASALLFAGLVTQSAGAVALSLLAPVPILLVSLGWGSLAGFLAALSAAAAVALFTGSFGSAIVLLASMALGAAIVGHLAGLARPADEVAVPSPAPGKSRSTATGPALAWYPLPRILTAIALVSAFGVLVLGYVLGFDAETIAPVVEEALIAQGGAAMDPQTRAQIGDLARLVVTIVPFAQPAFIVVTLVASLYVSAGITRASGRLQRPRDDVPAQAGLPLQALAIFAVALAGSFLGGSLGAVAAVFAGAFGAAFTLVGLAGFHRRTRGRAGRGLLLFTVYGAVVLLTFPLLAFLVLGVFDTARSRSAEAPSA